MPIINLTRISNELLKDVQDRNVSSDDLKRFYAVQVCNKRRNRYHPEIDHGDIFTDDSIFDILNEVCVV